MTRGRILFLTNQPLQPAIGGAALRNRQTLGALQKVGEVAAFSVVFPSVEWGEEPPGLALWRQHRAVLRSWVARNRRKHFWWLKRNEHRVSARLFTPTAFKDLVAVRDEFQPDVVVLAEPWLHRYLRAFDSWKVPVVYDAHNLECEVRGDGKLNASGSPSFDKRAGRVEGNVIRRASQIWTCSSDDADGFRRYYQPRGDVHVIPNTVDMSHYAREAGGGGEAPDLAGAFSIVYAGTYSYAPNAEAAQVLIEEIYPEVKRRIENCRLVLVGNRPTARMERAAREDSSILVTGFVEDVRPYLRSASVSVVPLMAGGGTRLKILECFAAEVPVVSTAKGAEGLDVEDGLHLLIRNSPMEIADAVMTIASVPGTGRALTEQALRLAEASYSSAAVERRISNAISSLI